MTVASSGSPSYSQLCPTWLQISSSYDSPTPWIWGFVRAAHRREVNTLTSLLYNNAYDKWYRWTVRWRDNTRWGPEESQAQELLPPWSWGTPSSQHIDMLTNAEALWTPYFGDFFMEASSCGHDQSLAQFLTLLLPHGLSGNQPPSRSSPSFASQEQKSCHPGNSKGFGSSSSGAGVKDQVSEQKMFLVSLSFGKLGF